MHTTITTDTTDTAADRFATRWRAIDVRRLAASDRALAAEAELEAAERACRGLALDLCDVSDAAAKVGGEPLRLLDIERGVLPPDVHRYGVAMREYDSEVSLPRHPRHVYETDAAGPEKALDAFEAEGGVQAPYSRADYCAFRISDEHVRR